MPFGVLTPLAEQILKVSIIDNVFLIFDFYKIHKILIQSIWITQRTCPILTKNLQLGMGAQWWDRKKGNIDKGLTKHAVCHFYSETEFFEITLKKQLTSAAELCQAQ